MAMLKEMKIGLNEEDRKRMEKRILDSVNEEIERMELIGDIQHISVVDKEEYNELKENGELEDNTYYLIVVDKEEEDQTVSERIEEIINKINKPFQHTVMFSILNETGEIICRFSSIFNSKEPDLFNAYTTEEEKENYSEFFSNDKVEPFLTRLILGEGSYRYGAVTIGFNIPKFLPIIGASSNGSPVAAIESAWSSYSDKDISGSFTLYLTNGNTEKYSYDINSDSYYKMIDIEILS